MDELVKPRCGSLVARSSSSHHRGGMGVRPAKGWSGSKYAARPPAAGDPGMRLGLASRGHRQTPTCDAHPDPAGSEAVARAEPIASVGAKGRISPLAAGDGKALVPVRNASTAGECPAVRRRGSRGGLARTGV